MSYTEETLMDVTSPTSSISGSSSSDSESISYAPQEAVPQILNIVHPKEEAPPELEMINNDQNELMLLKSLPGSPASINSLDIEEEKNSGMGYSQRVYCNPSCKIAAVLQQQSSELWKQFDTIGTEMIVTRRGR